jgi:hypothetical protein
MTPPATRRPLVVVPPRPVRRAGGVGLRRVALAAPSAQTAPLVLQSTPGPVGLLPPGAAKTLPPAPGFRYNPHSL